MKGRATASKAEDPPGENSVIVLLHALIDETMRNVGRQISNGSLTRVEDRDLQSQVLELVGSSLGSNTIFIPERPEEEIVCTPEHKYLHLYVKQAGKYCSFEWQVLDTKGHHRRFKASNFGSSSRVKSNCVWLPLRLDDGWNRVALDMDELCSKVYGTRLAKLVRLQLSAEMRIRRVLLCDENYTDEMLSKETTSWIDNFFVTQKTELSALSVKSPTKHSPFPD